MFHDLALRPDDHSSHVPQLLEQPHNTVYLGNHSSAAQRQLQHREAGVSSKGDKSTLEFNEILPWIWVGGRGQ